MRYAAFLAIWVVLAAAAVALASSFSPSFRPLQLISSVVLVVSVAVQRLNAVHKWLSSGHNRRKESADILAQQALVTICNGKLLSDQVLHLTVHVWEVPLWYRRIFPFAVRN